MLSKTDDMSDLSVRTTIFIEGMELYAFVGVHPHEHQQSQLLLVDINLDAVVAFSDVLVDSVDYEIIAEIAGALCSNGHIELVETYAYGLARACLQHSHVIGAKVTVRKPGAFDSASVAGVTIELRRDSV